MILNADRVLVDVVASAGIGTAVTATIAGSAGLYAWVTGYEVSLAGDGTGVVTADLSLTPIQTAGGTMSWYVTSVSTQGGMGDTFSHDFIDPARSSVLGGSVSLVLAAVAARASARITLHGFYSTYAVLP